MVRVFRSQWHEMDGAVLGKFLEITVPAVVTAQKTKALVLHSWIHHVVFQTVDLVHPLSPVGRCRRTSWSLKESRSGEGEI